jgi:hypothetical protein
LARTGVLANPKLPGFTLVLNGETKIKPSLPVTSILNQ